LNVSSDGDDVTVAGKLFHTRAAVAGNAQSPTADKRVEGTLSASVNVSLAASTATSVGRKSVVPKNETIKNKKKNVVIFIEPLSPRGVAE